MAGTAKTPKAPKTDITESPLYKKLVQVLPIFVKNPFSDNPRLNVAALYGETGMSNEGTYKWFRNHRLTPQNATMLLSIATREKNLAILKTLGRKAPTLEDFAPFVFAA